MGLTSFDFQCSPPPPGAHALLFHSAWLNTTKRSDLETYKGQQVAADGWAC